MLKELVITRDGIKTHDKVQVAIDRLRSFEPSDGYWLAFSGGKDSIVIKELKNPNTLSQRRIFDRVLEMCPAQLRCDGRNRRKDAMSARREQAIKALR